MNQKLANCSLALAWALGLAGGAAANTPSSVDGIVRVEGTKPGTGGTGTLIGLSQSGDDLRLAVLSADHTLQRIGALTTIGFGDASAPKLDLSAASAANVRIFDKGPDGTEDMAVIGLTFRWSDLSSSQQTYLSGLAPFAVVAAPSTPPFTFTATGFGKSGPVTSYGTQQQFANVANTYFTLTAGSYTSDANGNPLVYTQQMLGWTYNAPSTGDWVPGEGAGYGGYSGSPLLLSGSVVGIQSSGSDVVDGQTSIGLRMTDAYANWVNATVSAYVSPVPEPAEWSLMLTGGLCMARRARRAQL